MITSIEITRFRGIREGKLEDLTPLVVLVGPNGCGKSSVLDALFIGGSLNGQQAVNSVRERHKGVPHKGRWLAWRADVRNPAQLTIGTSAGASETWTIMFERDGSYTCCCRPTEALEKQLVEQGFRVSVRPRTERLEGIPDIRLVEPTAFEDYPPLHQLYTEAANAGRKQEAKAIIKELVSGRPDLEILTEGDTPVIHLVFEDHSVPVAFAGDGLYSLVRLGLALASRPDGTVLVEEPEAHQHPAAIRHTVRAIWAAVRRDIQVILTTHSLELIDAIVAESSPGDVERLCLYRLELENGKLIAVRVPGPDVVFSRTEVEKDLR